MDIQEQLENIVGVGYDYADKPIENEWGFTVPSRRELQREGVNPDRLEHWKEYIGKEIPGELQSQILEQGITHRTEITDAFKHILDLGTELEETSVRKIVAESPRWGDKETPMLSLKEELRQHYNSYTEPRNKWKELDTLRRARVNVIRHRLYEERNSWYNQL